MKRISLAFSSIEGFLSFVGSTKAIHLSIVPKQKIVRGLFTEQEVATATSQFGALVLPEGFE